ncbi:hypothetical protein ACHQM5_010910 [Ranunculus cassubicifolius]
MSSATSSLFKTLAITDTHLTSLPTLFTPKTSYPFSPLPSKPIKSLQLSYSSSPSWISPIHKNSSSNFTTLVASTSDWAQQDENTVDEPTVPDFEGEVSSEGVEEEEEEIVGGEEEFVDPPEEAKLFVGNLPYDVTSEKLAELFEEAGIVQVSEVIYNRETDQSRGFGFVWMQTVEEAEKAIQKFNRYALNGRYLTVNIAAPRGSRPERPPRTFDEPSFRMYVGNLPWQVDDARLEQLFSEHGKVVQARVVYDRDTGRSRGFGFVSMSTQSELDDAIEALDGQSLEGRTIRVNVAEERPRRNTF